MWSPQCRSLMDLTPQRGCISTSPVTRTNSGCSVSVLMGATGTQPSELVILTTIATKQSIPAKCLRHIPHVMAPLKCCPVKCFHSQERFFHLLDWDLDNCFNHCVPQSHPMNFRKTTDSSMTGICLHTDF